MRKRNRGEQTTFVETPKGVFTASGVWFRTSGDALRSYAGPVLELRPLKKLLPMAEVWLRSSQSMALWVLPVFLSIFPPLIAAICTLALYALWQILAPGLVFLSLVNVLWLLDNLFVLFAFYLVTLSLFAVSGQMIQFGTELAAFILLRWGLVQSLFDPLIAPLKNRLYRLPIPDQVLRVLIVRLALKYRVSLPEIDEIERQMVATLNRESSTRK